MPRTAAATSSASVSNSCCFPASAAPGGGGGVCIFREEGGEQQRLPTPQAARPAIWPNGKSSCFLCEDGLTPQAAPGRPTPPGVGLSSGAACGVMPLDGVRSRATLEVCLEALLETEPQTRFQKN